MSVNLLLRLTEWPAKQALESDGCPHPRASRSLPCPLLRLLRSLRTADTLRRLLREPPSEVYRHHVTKSGESKSQETSKYPSPQFSVCLMCISKECFRFWLCHWFSVAYSWRSDHNIQSRQTANYISCYIYIYVSQLFISKMPKMHAASVPVLFYRLHRFFYLLICMFGMSVSLFLRF